MNFIRADNMSAEGFKPPDEKWEQMKAIWDACNAARVVVPPEVNAYFCGEDPDLGGVPVDESELLALGAVIDWSDDTMNAEGVEILVDLIPDDVKVIRVYNSY